MRSMAKGGGPAAKLSTTRSLGGLPGLPRLTGRSGLPAEPGLPGLPPGRGRRPPPDSNGHFVLAFADALGDILREERRRAA
jgi:hypothetical protein